MANIIFYILGGLVFKYNIYLDIYWRSYIHTLPICIKNKLCIHKSIELQDTSVIFGILNYLIECGLYYILPTEYTLIMMFFITFVFDCIIFNLDIKHKSNITFINILLKSVWKISQYLIVGYIETKKRKIGNKDVVE